MKNNICTTVAGANTKMHPKGSLRPVRLAAVGNALYVSAATSSPAVYSSGGQMEPNTAHLDSSRSKYKPDDLADAHATGATSS
mmetsp:Transcript_16506/g.42847  ORF Transcript_16506/g.42847 Transcript_16506/m.42847 type:complete len:83 (-) Transcript_16506:880-1128(-)